IIYEYEGSTDDTDGRIGNQREERRGEELSQVVDIAGEAHQQVAGARAVVEAQREALDVGEETLADRDDDILANARSQHALAVVEDALDECQDEDRADRQLQDAHAVVAEPAV